MKQIDFSILETDVAIIGAGVSGLYSAWRLLTGKHNVNEKYPGGHPSVCIFEMSDRIGGRLFSVKDHPAIPNLVAELGGMRYMQHQEITSSLIDKVFKLESEDFPVSDERTINKNIIYMRGQRFHESDFEKEGFTTKYNLPPEVQGKHPDNLFQKIVDNVLLNNGISTVKRDRKEWDQIKNNLIYYKGPDKGEKLNNMGFWNLIKDQIGNEGYNYLSDTGAYYSNTINWNAAEAMPYVTADFVGNPKFKTLKGGYDKLAEELADAFIKEGGQIFINSQMINFKRIEDNISGYKYSLEIRDTSNNVESHVLCNSIILAMPRRSLELLNQDNPLFENGENLTFLENVRSVLGEPSFKLLMVFESPNGKPWWNKQLGIEKGRSVTDLPMRQCYYFGTDEETNASLMLASYNDMRTVDFWKPLEPLDIGKQKFKSLYKEDSEFEKYVPRSTEKISQQQLLDIDKIYPLAPKRLVEHSLDQLAELHGLISIPEPITTIFKNWDDDPYGGGYHAWKARYDIGAVMKYMRKPKANEEIHICGEAYSDQQGWIEGAFCVAERMLQDEYKLTPPLEWLSANYYLGR
jgi:hypothetical protein